MSPVKKGSARAAPPPSDDLIESLQKKNVNSEALPEDSNVTVSSPSIQNLGEISLPNSVMPFDVESQEERQETLVKEGLVAAKTAKSALERSGVAAKESVEALQANRNQKTNSNTSTSTKPNERTAKTVVARMEDAGSNTGSSRRKEESDNSAPYDFEKERKVLNYKEFPMAPPPPPPIDTEASQVTQPKLAKLETVLRKLRPKSGKSNPTPEPTNENSEGKFELSNTSPSESSPDFNFGMAQASSREQRSEEIPATRANEDAKLSRFQAIAPPPQPKSKTVIQHSPYPMPWEAAEGAKVSDEDKTVPLAEVKKDGPSTAVSEQLGARTENAKTSGWTQQGSTHSPEEDPEAEKFMPTEIRANSPGVRFREELKVAQASGAPVFSSAEAALRQSENLRIAQKRISDLEVELERVRRENENLRAAGDTLRRRIDELQSQAESSEADAQETKKIAEEEKRVLRGQIHARDRELSEAKGRLEDAESRLEANFRKIRVRERDLEHRIEIIKAESNSIAASKDRMILELKRQLDQANSELSHAKNQVQETLRQVKNRQETSRKAVRAMRIALTVLEGEDGKNKE